MEHNRTWGAKGAIPVPEPSSVWPHPAVQPCPGSNMRPLCPALPGMVLMVHVPDLRVVWQGINIFILPLAGRKSFCSPACWLISPWCLLGIRLLNVKAKILDANSCREGWFLYTSLLEGSILIVGLHFSCQGEVELCSAQSGSPSKSLAQLQCWDHRRWEADLEQSVPFSSWQSQEVLS